MRWPGAAAVVELLVVEKPPGLGTGWAPKGVLEVFAAPPNGVDEAGVDALPKVEVLPEEAPKAVELPNAGCED